MSDRFASLLKSATFKSTRETSKVEYTRLDEAARFLESDDDVQNELNTQLKRDGYRLDELSDDSDIDLIMPTSRPKSPTLLERVCCAMM